ncbi:protein-disulfide reductase DsbD family protein [Candidatus Marinimicrobia bacterium]|nr:protein-disulfide reductase DsbD family protein [Candidatus Neomarinimicrobiota bacterium]MDA9735348.1 protein-disulfide reductase DsbD family protein [Candidatus Neomarinimicrobiota bacterium]
MKKFFLTLSFLNILWAQFSDPAQFTVNIDDVNQGEVAIIDVNAELDFTWRIYAVYDVPEGPSSTKFIIESDIVNKSGRVIEPEPIEKFDEGFGNITKYHEGTPQFSIPLELKDDLPNGTYNVDVIIDYQVCNNSLCYPPNQITKTATFDIKSGPIRSDFVFENFDFDKDSILAIADNNISSFLVLAMSMGFLALLTPCVFPMIPITISFFMHRSENTNSSPVKSATVYMLGIVLTFTFLGMMLAILLGASGANQLAANPIVNMFIAFLFIYFAMSLFGFYEIEIPESLRRLSLQKENSEGYVGILFMALTFTLTSFTCTVQFMGLILVAASQGEWFWPIIGMLIFSLAFASPFFFLALFPHYLTKLPQSGGWLNSVKVVMGFLELAAAFKFISNTDLVWNWNIFTYEVVLYLWALIMLLTGLYIFGLIKFKNDSPVTFSIQRSLFALAFIFFGTYLAAGNHGYDINGNIKSYLPPKKYQSNLVWNNNLDDAFIIAAEQNKNIFIDFTGVTCTNCRWMETNIFSINSVEELMSEYVLVSLYTDAGEGYLEKREYQINRFETAALPYYVILDSNDKVLSEFPGLTRNVEEFKDFLKTGLNN